MKTIEHKMMWPGLHNKTVMSKLGPISAKSKVPFEVADQSEVDSLKAQGFKQIKVGKAAE